MKKNKIISDTERLDLFDRIMSTHFLKRLFPFYNRYKEQLLYLFFGVLTTLINLIAFWIFVSGFNISVLGANILAWIVAVIFAYITNRKWVFDSNQSSIIKEAISFAVGRLATLVMEEVVLWVGIGLIHVNAFVVKMIAQVMVVIGNYVISKFVVFRRAGEWDGG